MEKGQRMIHVTSYSPNAIKDINLHPNEHLSAHLTKLQSHSRVQGKGFQHLILGRQHGLLERAQKAVRRPGFKTGFCYMLLTSCGTLANHILLSFSFLK